MLRKIATVNCSCGQVVVECYEQARDVASLYNLGRGHGGHGLPRGPKCSNVLLVGYRWRYRLKSSPGIENLLIELLMLSCPYR